MDRLRDLTDASDSASTLASKLLRATRPTIATPEVQERVRAGIAARAAHPGLAFRAKLLIATTPIVVSLAVGAYLATRTDRAVTLRPAPPVVRDEPKSDLPSEPAVAVAPLMRRESIKSPSHHHRSVSRPVDAAPRLPRPEPSDERESMLLVEAAERLRKQRDASGARDLVDLYLQRFADGVLVEEAFAIALEAASVAPDGARDRRIASEYLRRFPGGRFRQEAVRVIDQSDG